MRQSWTFLGVIILLSGLILLFFGIQTLPPRESPDRESNARKNQGFIETPAIDFANPSKGPLDAKVTIIEFGDFLCGACATARQTLQRIADEYPNDVRIVWKDFPNTSLHDNADEAAIAARCAERQGRFWEYHDELFKHQASINERSLPVFAQNIGLDVDAFGTCLNTRDTVAVIDRDFIEGQRLRVDTIPYFFVNNKRYSGGLSYDQLKLIIESTPDIR